MVPTPTPAPPMPMQAIPAPIYLAAIGSMMKLLFSSSVGKAGPSVARVKGIVEVDAGEDGEHVSLQEGDQEFERGQRDGEGERQRCPDPAQEPEPAQHRDESGEYLERDVPGQHVGKQTHAMGDRARQEGQHLDEHDQWQDVDRDALGHEQIEEVEAVLPEPVDEDGEEHEQRQRCSDDDMARHREIVRDDPDHVGDQDEHEQREHQREELHPALANGVAYGVGDEFVGEFGDRLHAPRHELPSGGGAEHQGGGNPDRDTHVQGRVRESDVNWPDFAERKVFDDLELMDRIGHDRSGFLRFLIPTPPAHTPSGRTVFDYPSGGAPGSRSGATPAARITFTTPAAKPSNKNTISPHGEIPSMRSSAQPTAAPTRTPATSSLESRNPRAYPDASAAGRPRCSSDGSPGRCWPS